MPRSSNRSKPSKLQVIPERRELDIWTVCNDNLENDVTIVKQTLAWAEEPNLDDLTQTVVQRIYGKRRERFKGQSMIL